MKPLILKFARRHPEWEFRSPPTFEYCTELEGLAYNAEVGRRIDERMVLLELTGSLTTQAQLDPTRDEPTDR